MPALLLALQAAAPAEPTATPFDINKGLIFWTILVFGILVAVLWRWAWPAILQSVEDRERRIQKQLDEAEAARAESQRLVEEQRQMLARARADAQDILTKAHQVAEKEREALLARTRDDQDQLVERARREIEREKEKAVLALRREAVDVALAAASKLVEKNLSAASDRRIVADYLSSLGKEA